MAVGGILRFFTGRGQESAPPPQPVEDSPGLAGLFADPVKMAPATVEALRGELEQGLELYASLRDSRLELALAAFDEDMRKALFEIIFLLHVNHPSLADWHYESAVLTGGQGARKKTSTVPMTADLYLEGAPHGVKGIEHMPAILREPLEAYVRETFGRPLNGNGAASPVIVNISSGGSIGTIGHKSGVSDLDLNVQYDLSTFAFDTTQWSDDTFTEALDAERNYWIERARRSQNLMPEALHDPSVAQELNDFAQGKLTKTYPLLCRHYLEDKVIPAQVLWSGENGELRGKLMAELMLLMKRSAGVVTHAATQGQEALLKERIGRIQEYISNKFPTAEIYMFPSSNSAFRQGWHASTLESKESPGSAYELLLNYETILPGIQFTPLVPTHFVLSQVLNNHAGRYGRFVDYIRFGLLDVFKDCREQLVDLGATPDLTPQYVAKHHGAVFWEAFKASSGNLPKASLNLLRYEMLLDPRFPKSSVQMIKSPDALDGIISPPPKDKEAELAAVARDEIGLPTWMLLQMETAFPSLRADPWWLRFKALKIAFGDKNGVKGLAPGEMRQISKTIDLAFALHVRISDVFTKPGDTRPFDSLREQVLLEFNRQAFPEQSPRRIFLEHMFAGEVRAINHFEQSLRDLFKSCLERVQQKISAINPAAEKPSAEFEIWHHYYQQNFEPAPNVVQRAIMHQLKVPRGRIQAAYDAEAGWKFRSLQRESNVGKRFDTFGTMDHLPDEVVLHENPSFLGGLAHCILNGYYGTVNRGTLNERRTALEFDATSVDMGHEAHNTLAFVRPDQVERIMERVHQVFPYQPYDYLDCVRLKREVSEVFVFVNLLHFGRLSILYRDNMQTWYCDEFDHPELLENWEEFSASPDAILQSRPLHDSLGKFFKSRGVRPREVGLAAWVNLNSVKTSHGIRQHIQKEEELAKSMMRQILLEHGTPRKKAPPPDAPAHPPVQGAPAMEAATSPQDARADAAPGPRDGQPDRASSAGDQAPAKHEVAASDWKGRYEQMMERMGIDLRVAGEKGRKKHPKFRPKAAGKELRIQAGEASGKLISFAADALSFSTSGELPTGKEMFAEIEGKVIVRIRVVGCRKLKEDANGEAPYRVDSWITNEEQGYRCFVMLASDLTAAGN